MTTYNAEATAFDIEADSPAEAARKFAAMFHGGNIEVHVADEDAGESLGDSLNGFDVPPVHDHLSVLLAKVEAGATSTRDRVGIDFENEDPLPAMDSSESEDYGYWLALTEVAEDVRTMIQIDTDEPDRSKILRHAMGLLRLIIELEGGSGSGSIVGDGCEDALTILTEATTEEGAPAVDLLDLSRRAVEAAVDGRQESVGSAVINIPSAPTIEARQIARVLNALYGHARRVR